MINLSTERTIYLDYQSTTPVAPEVVKDMQSYWSVEFGNPHSSEHAFGWRADEAVQKARSAVANSIRADADEIIFTSGATEANNLAIIGSLAHKSAEGKRIIVSAIEHKCVLQAARHMSSAGYEVAIAPVGKDGMVDIQKLSDLIDNRAALVSIMTANNEIGTIQPIKEISKLCQKYGVTFHTDAAQAVCAGKLDTRELGINLMSLSAHKLYGPKGIGALYVSRESRNQLSPIIHGGGQEGGLRSGTLPTPLCVGFGSAVNLLTKKLDSDITANLACRTAFLNVLDSAMISYRINGSVNGHPSNLNIRLIDVDADILISNLQPKVAISSGAACSSGIPEPSHVLRAIGLTTDQASECIRISFGRFTSPDQVIRAANIIAETAKLQALRS